LARPPKEGFDYFPLDCDIFRDKKVTLIRAEFGAKSMYVLLYLLCETYRENGYFLEWGDDACLAASEGAGGGCSPEYISEVVRGCVRRSIFNGRVFDAFGVLTSAGIQRRFMRMLADRTNVVVFEEYWLLDAALEKDVPPSALRKLVFKRVSPTENPVKPTENPVKPTDNQQSKVKKSKVSNPPLPPQGEAPAAQGAREPDYGRVLELFKELCPSLPEPQEVTKPRRGAIKSAGATLKKRGLKFQQLFERVEASDYLSGRSGKWDGCGFDWMLKPANLLKVLEGNYDNARGQGGAEGYPTSFDLPAFDRATLQVPIFEEGGAQNG